MLARVCLGVGGGVRLRITTRRRSTTCELGGGCGSDVFKVAGVHAIQMVFLYVFSMLIVIPSTPCAPGTLTSITSGTLKTFFVYILLRASNRFAALIAPS